MTGSVYPCEKCGDQNWVMDIDDNGLCPKCAREMSKSMCPWCGDDYEVTAWGRPHDCDEPTVREMDGVS